MPPPPPSCPRCGYDLSGEIATWDAAGACPMDGTCPECGLQVGWYDIFNRDTWRVDGFVEHAKGVRGTLAWAFRTTAWCIWPWRFWSRVEMFHRVRARGWLWWLLAAIWMPRVLSLLIPDVFGQIPGTVFRGFFGYNFMPGLYIAFHAVGVDYQYMYWPSGGVWFGSSVALSTQTAWVAFAILGWPFSMVVLPISLRAARVRPALVLRAAVFGLAPIAALAAVQLLVSVLGVAGACVIELAARPPRPGSTSVYMTWYDLWVAAHQFVSEANWVVIPWLALWWLAALTKGFKLRHGVLAWLALLLIVHVALVVILGVEIHGFGGYFRI